MATVSATVSADGTRKLWASSERIVRYTIHSNFETAGQLRALAASVAVFILFRLRL